MIVKWYEGGDKEGTNVRLRDIGGSQRTINVTLEIPVDLEEEPRESGEDSPTPDIEILQATTFEDLLASDQTIETFAL